MAAFGKTLANLAKGAIDAANSEDRRRLMPVVRDSDAEHTDDSDNDYGQSYGDSVNLELSESYVNPGSEMDILTLAEEEVEEYDYFGHPDDIARFYEMYCVTLDVRGLTAKRAKVVARGDYAAGKSVVYAPLGLSEVHDIALKKVKIKPMALTRPWHAVYVSLVKVVDGKQDEASDTNTTNTTSTTSTNTSTHFELGERVLIRREVEAGTTAQRDDCWAIGGELFDCMVPALVNALSGNQGIAGCMDVISEQTGKQSWFRTLLSFTVLAEHALSHPADANTISDVLINHGHTHYFVPGELAQRVRWRSFHKYSLASAGAWYIKFERADDRPFAAGEDENWSVEVEIDAIYNVWGN